MMSEWCDSHHWWKDAKFSQQNLAIPRNQIDEVEVDSSFFTYAIIENAQCYSQIPYLKCNNIHIVLSTGSIDFVGGGTGRNTRGLFTCAELDASNVVAGNEIIFSHWNSNTYCQWNINSFSGGSNDIDQIIFEGLNYFILNNSSFIRKSQISANTINLSGVTLQSIDKYVTRLTAKKGDVFSILNNVTCNGNRFQYNGSFLVDRSTIEGTGNGKFIFQNNSINKATLSGSFLFDSCVNEGNIYGSNTFFVASSGKACVNKGTVYGDAIFSGVGSVNAGTVSGTTIFISGGINKGTILEPAIFYSGTSNQGGTLSKYSWFDYATNDGPILSGSKFTFSTNKYSIGDGSGSFLFANNSNNRGSIGASGVIAFVSGSNNWDDLTAPSAIVVFDLGSFNQGGSIQGIATFGSGCSNVNGATVTTGVFNNNSINSGMISSLGIFNDSSINMWDAANAIFNNHSANSGRIIDSGRFEGFSHNGAIVKNGYFYGRSTHFSGATVQANAIFCNQARNISGSTISKLAEFGQSSINYGGGSNTFNFFENAVNYGYIDSEKVFFSGSSVNKNYGKKIHFYNTTVNDIMGSGYEAAFLNNSTNNGYISYTGHFYNASQNGKLGVLNTGIFHDFSINNGSMRRPLVSGLEVLTSGYRKIDILDSGINNASLYNVEFNVKTSGINRGNLQWVFDPLIIFTTSGIYKTGTIPQTLVETGTFRSSYNSATIPTITFDDSSTNRGNIAGYKDIKFLKKAGNYGNIRTYPPIETNTPCVTFQGSGTVFDIPPSAIFCKNYGNIQNGVIFKNAINFSSIGSGDFTDSSNSGSAEFASFSKSRNYGYIDKFGIFNDSINFGIINQSGFFYDSTNLGPVYSGYFNNSSNSGSLNIAEFVNGSKNSGNILQSGSFFNSYNLNQSIPLPLATFAGESNNSGIVALGYYYGGSTNSNTGLVNEFYDGSKNKGIVFQQAIFSGSSTNIGLVTNRSYFRGNSVNLTSGLGLLFFYDSSVNLGLLSGVVSFESGVNEGTIVGDQPVSFYSGSLNNNLIIGDTTFALNSLNNGNAYVKGKGIFLSESRNNGIISGDSSFSSGCKNNGIVISGHAIFLSGSTNDNRVIGTSTFYNSINKSYVSGESKFYDSINLGYSESDSLFYGTGYNAGIVGTLGTGFFNNQSFNNGTVNIGEFRNTSYNKNVVSLAYLYDSSVNQGTINNGYFYNQSSNSVSGTIFIGHFLFGGTNYGTISSNVSFNSAFSKSGTIGGDAIFTNNSYCEKTSINGSATFDNTSCYDKNTTNINGTITKSQDCNP